MHSTQHLFILRLLYASPSWNHDYTEWNTSVNFITLILYGSNQQISHSYAYFPSFVLLCNLLLVNATVHNKFLFIC